jgi:hypothetical protein
MLKYVVAALAVVVALQWGVLAWQDGRLSKAKAALTIAEGKLEQALKTIAGQKDVLQRCSDATDALKAEGVKRQVAADQALLQAQQEARRYVDGHRRLTKLLADPSPPGARCTQAIGAIRKELRK